MRTSVIRRGDVFYISRYGVQQGSEQMTGRPGVVVSNNLNNKYCDVVEVAYCTTQEKNNLPVHVKINTTQEESTVLCEQITTVSVEKLGDYIGHCSEDEMQRIDKAIAISLGLCSDDEETESTEQRDYEKRLSTLQTKLDMYQEMYNNLLDRFLNER